MKNIKVLSTQNQLYHIEGHKKLYIQWLPLHFASGHVILATNILFTFIYELMVQDLRDNVYINIHVFPLPPLKAMVNKNQ